MTKGFWHTLRVTCWTVTAFVVWVGVWTVLAVEFTRLYNHVAGTLTGMAWGLGSLMLGGWLLMRATPPTMEEITESEPDDVRILPVLLKPYSIGNDTNEWRVVKGDDYLAYMNEQRDTLAYVPFVHESDAIAFREHLIMKDLA